MRLVEFKSTESELFEALSVIFFGADAPSPKELKASNKAEDEFEKHGVETKDSKFKMAACPFCRQRIGLHARILTLPSGKGADFVLEDKVFDYINSRFDAWEAVRDANLKRPFAELQDRFETAKSNKELDDLTKIQDYLKKRDNPQVSV